MTKVLTFKVGIEGLENKIWRIVEITDRRTVADLAYTILASFDSLAYHLYEIKYNERIFDCGLCDEDELEDFYEVPPINAIISKLSSIGLKENDSMEMEYDLGSPTIFKINYLGSRDLEKGNGTHYPYIIDGSGRGMLDDISAFELKEIINDIDQKGYSEHTFTPGYERTIMYDYRVYDVDTDNALLKGIILEIKNGYEVKE